MAKKVVKKPKKKCRPCGKVVMKSFAPIVLECPAGNDNGEWHVRLKRVDGVCSLKLVAV